MKSPGPANTDPSSTAGYPAALYNTVGGGGEGLWDQHPHYTMECTVDVICKNMEHLKPQGCSAHLYCDMSVIILQAALDGYCEEFDAFSQRQ